MIDDDRNRAVLNAGGMGGKARSLRNLCDTVGRQLRGDVDIIDLAAHQRVAHTSANEPRAAGARRFERRKESLRFLSFKPIGEGDACGHARPLSRVSRTRSMSAMIAAPAV